MALDGAELSVLDARQLELPCGEPLTHLGDRGAQNSTPLRRSRSAEPVTRRLRLRGQPWLAPLLGQQPRVPVAGENDVSPPIAHGRDYRSASPRVQPPHAAAPEPPPG